MVVLETQGVLLPEAARSLLLHKGKETVQEDAGCPASEGFLWTSHVIDSGQAVRPHCSSP